MIAVRIVQGNVITRECLFKDLPIKIGRDPSSDVILFDSSVSRHHAIIEQNDDGIVQVNDFDSQNGLRMNGRKVDRVHIENKLRLHVGVVEIEIDCLAQGKTREIALDEIKFIDRRRTPKDYLQIVGIGLAGWLIAVLLQPTFWSPWNEDRATSLVWHTLGYLIGLTSISFLLLLVLRVLGRKLRIGDTLTIFSRLSWTGPGLTTLWFISYYVMSISGFRILQLISTGIVVIWCTVKIAELRREKKNLLFQASWIAGMTLFLVAIGVTMQLTAKRAGMPHTDYFILPPLLGYSGRMDTFDDHLENVARATKKAEQEGKNLAKGL